MAKPKERTLCGQQRRPLTGRLHPGLPSEIISELRATSNRNAGRDHPGIPGDFSRNHHQGPLRVTTTNAFAGRWLVPRLPLWRAAHPEMALEVIGTDAVVDLRARDADLAIRYAHVAPPDLLSQELFRDRFWPVCSPQLLSAGPPIKNGTDVARYPLIQCLAV